MSLRSRLTLTFLGILTVTALVVLTVTDLAFSAQQQRELSDVLARELERSARVVRSGELGATLLTEGDANLKLQFVSLDGRVVIPADARNVLPLHSAATTVNQIPGLSGRWIVSSIPWQLGSGVQAGTIRGAVSLTGLDGARRDLRATLLAIGLATSGAAAALLVLALRRALRPLTGLARQAAHLDPADPRFARYEGPEDEVGQVAVALNHALLAIRERREAERERLADVAHELAAPLTVVNAHLDELMAAWSRREDVIASDSRRVNAARAAADDLMYVSQDLLTLARGDLGERMRWEIVDMGVVAKEIHAAHPAMRLRVGDGDLRVVADGARVRQVLRNLIRNAERAAGSDEKVSLIVSCVGDARAPESVLLRVEDEGPGLRGVEPGAIFERYHTRTGGTGLGLAVVQRLVDRLGGTVAAEPREGGQGAAFVVALPSYASTRDACPDEV